jgi:hypothetical protein
MFDNTKLTGTLPYQWSTWRRLRWMYVAEWRLRLMACQQTSHELLPCPEYPHTLMPDVLLAYARLYLVPTHWVLKLGMYKGVYIMPDILFVQQPIANPRVILAYCMNCRCHRGLASNNFEGQLPDAWSSMEAMEYM